MKQNDRIDICNQIRRELAEGTHTYTMCKCGRHGSRGELCWECLLDKLEEKE